MYFDQINAKHLRKLLQLSIKCNCNQSGIQTTRLIKFSIQVRDQCLNSYRNENSQNDIQELQFIILLFILCEVECVYKVL